MAQDVETEYKTLSLISSTAEGGKNQSGVSNKISQTRKDKYHT
jgi:hypothetical protein